MTADRVVARAVDSAFRCEVCGERCTSKRALDEHATTHPVTADVQRELAVILARHRLVTPRQCFCGEREPYDERDAGFHRPEWHVAHVLTTLLPLIADAEKRAAARALRNLAVSAPVVRYDTGGYPVRAVPVSELLSAAAALDPSGAAEGAGR